MTTWARLPPTDGLDRKIIRLNVSNPDTAVTFNPFRRAANGDICGQVDRLVDATMHAWGFENPREIPTFVAPCGSLTPSYWSKTFARRRSATWLISIPA